ncbi:hypothetical protein L7F22_064136 [Adiantum nelumboides]|nr:hypothetical protein [Adiantum nelumboides]
MRTSQVVVCVIVGFLGLVAFSCGLAGQFTRAKASDARISDNGNTCSYPSSRACALGVIGALCILFDQILGNSFGGCVCCCAKNYTLSSSSKAIAIACLVISWISTILAFIFLLTAAVVNSSLTYFTNDRGSCPYPSSWVFPVGACLALIATLTLLSFYILSRKNLHEPPPPPSTVVQMPYYYNPTKV